MSFQGKTSPIKTESSTASSPPKSVISPVVLKKPAQPAQPAHLVIQDGVRSDLLKAIRDGELNFTIITNIKYLF